MFFQPSPKRPRRPQLQLSERRLLLMIGDVIAITFSWLVALRIWALVARYPFTLDFILPQTYLLVILLALWLLLASASDFYDLRTAASRQQILTRLLLVNAQMVVIYVLIFFFSPRDALPRLFILYFALTALITIGIWRLTRPFLLGWVSEPRRVLIVGVNPAVEIIISAMRQHAANDYVIMGLIGTSDEVGSVVCNVPVIGTGSDLMNYIARDHVSELIITSTQELQGETFQGVMDAYEQGVALSPLTLVYEHITGRVPVEHVNNDWAVVLLPMQRGAALFALNGFLKRVLDITLALLGLVVFIVTLPLLALLIRLDSPGGIFYSQERVGLNGRTFRIYKYRSMVADAEARTGAVFSRRGDPRITRVGRIMRKTRLDELPQVVNILRGEMSVVGPRPERPEHVHRLTEKIPFYRTRLIVRPGLTGWAQVRYDYGANDEDALVKLEYDLYYIRHQSVLLDLSIMVRTVGKVLAFKGV